MVKRGPVRTHQAIQFLFARVSEGRMPDVMRQRQRLGQVFVQAQRRRDGTRDLRHLNRMRQTIAEMVGKAAREDLRLIFQPAKCPRVHHAVAIALKIVAVGMRMFGIAPPARAFHGVAQMG